MVSASLTLMAMAFLLHIYYIRQVRGSFRARFKRQLLVPRTGIEPG